MRTSLRRIAMAAAIIAVGTATAALPGTAGARWHGGWPGHDGWGWGRFGWGFAPSFAIGFGTPFTAGVMAACITPTGATAPLLGD